MTTSRTDFNETWLTEMPENIGYTEMYDVLTYNIADIKKAATPEEISPGFFRYDGEQSVYYWYETDNVVTLGVEFYKKPQSLVVAMVSKRHRGRKPFASDLYNAVLKDRNAGGINSIRIMSDEQLSEEGFKIWARLLSQGHKISVYVARNPGQSFTQINNIEDMKKYFKDDDTDYQQYQYVITESKKLVETIMSFNTRRMRELSGLSLTDHIVP